MSPPVSEPSSWIDLVNGAYFLIGVFPALFAFFALLGVVSAVSWSYKVFRRLGRGGGAGRRVAAASYPKVSSGDLRVNTGDWNGGSSTYSRRYYKRFYPRRSYRRKQYNLGNPVRRDPDGDWYE